MEENLTMGRHHKALVLISLILYIACTFMPIYAKSDNHVSKVVTVGRDEVLSLEVQKELVPYLSIELKDELTKEDRFYLNLHQAEWMADYLPIEIKAEGGEPITEGIKVEAVKITATQLELKVIEGNLMPLMKIRVPLVAKVIGEQATVAIDSNNTTLSSETLLFAFSSTEKGSVTAMTPIKTLDKGSMTKLTIEEAYGGQFSSSLAKKYSNKVLLTLNNRQFTWELTDSSIAEPKLIGIKGYEKMNAGLEAFKCVSDTKLEITLPTSIEKVSKTNKGAFLVEGVGIKPLERNPKLGKISATVQGELIKETTLEVFEAADFAVILKPDKKYEVLVGKKLEVGFTLEEVMANSILKDRPIKVRFTGGATLPLTDKGEVEASIGGKTYTFSPLKEEERIVGFEILKLDMPEVKDKLTHHFNLTLNIPSKAEDKVKIIIEGKAVPSTLEEVMVQVTPVAKLQVEAFGVKDGLKDQVGGEMTLIETTSGSLTQGEKITIQIDSPHIEITKAPFVAVTDGDLEVGEPKLIDGAVEIEVLRKSSKPSTVVIKHFTLSVSGAVADGRYDAIISGKALSQLADKEKDTLIGEAFILVNVAPKDRKVIKFRLGDESYFMNGKYYHLDVPAYVENGRTMVPVKYVAEALGIPSEKVKWKPETEEITLYANKIIELEVDSTIMRVDGEKIDMAAPVKLVKGRTMAPIGEIARALELDVEWNKKLRTATFVSK